MIFLSENGYKTVTSDAIAALVRRGIRPSPKSVALCFDDAWKSLQTDAAPLLKKHGFQAISYVSPALIAENDLPDNPFVSWAGLRELHTSGLIDIQAHSKHHALVFCDAAIKGFVRPGFSPHIHSRSLIKDHGAQRFLAPDDLGAPLHMQRSRLSDAMAYDDESVREACMHHVRENGGDSFFARPTWEHELRLVAESSGPGRFETEDERDAEILKELIEAREMLNSRLGTDSVRHMCFPWAICGKTAEQAAKKAGYETAFGDRLFGKRSVRAGDNPYRLMRLKHQHIYCLPGKGRRTLPGRLLPS
jgi:peptidoglycan/xylan/chitin deacetylase (PgdA/CDA1 family)